VPLRPLGGSHGRVAAPGTGRGPPDFRFHARDHRAGRRAARHDWSHSSRCRQASRFSGHPPRLPLRSSAAQPESMARSTGRTSRRRPHLRPHRADVPPAMVSGGRPFRLASSGTPPAQDSANRSRASGTHGSSLLGACRDRAHHCPQRIRSPPGKSRWSQISFVPWLTPRRRERGRPIADVRCDAASGRGRTEARRR
jgi:hypothetical protein